MMSVKQQQGKADKHFYRLRRLCREWLGVAEERRWLAQLAHIQTHLAGVQLTPSCVLPDIDPVNVWSRWLISSGVPIKSCLEIIAHGRSKSQAERLIRADNIRRRYRGTSISLYSPLALMLALPTDHPHYWMARARCAKSVLHDVTIANDLYVLGVVGKRVTQILIDDPYATFTIEESDVE